MLVVAMSVCGTPVFAAPPLGSDQWNVPTGDGVTTRLNWFEVDPLNANRSKNWLNGNIPNDAGGLSSGFTADFSRNPLSVARQLITLDQEATIGHLLLGDLTGNGAYRFTGETGVLGVNNAMAFASAPGQTISIEKRSGGNDVIENDLKLWDPDFDVSVLTAGSSLTLAGRVYSASGSGQSVNKYGGGTLRITHDLSGEILTGDQNLALNNANLAAASVWRVFGGVLESGNSVYTVVNSPGAANPEIWSSVFGRRNVFGSGTTIELYGAQLNIRNNGLGAPSATAQTIIYGNDISIIRDSVINLVQFSAGYTNRTIRFGQLRVGDGTVVVNSANGYALQLDSVLVEGSAARLFSNQNIFVTTISGDASLNKFGSGTLVLTGAANVTGGINLLQGVLWADHDTATRGSRVIVSPNTRLEVSYQDAIPGDRGNGLFLTSSVNSANPGFGIFRPAHSRRGGR
ncbi:MAG: hypothetical protein QM775_13295 [Pirellulales bacterium]